MDSADMRKVLTLATNSNPVLVLMDIPRPGEPGPHFLFFLSLVDKKIAARTIAARTMSFDTYWGGWSLVRSGTHEGPEGLDAAVEWALALFDAGPSAWGDRLIPQIAEVNAAFTAARSARFEHGESGPGVVPSPRQQSDQSRPLGPPPARLGDLLPGVTRQIARNHGVQFGKESS
jgi:hypothetical protein